MASRSRVARFSIETTKRHSSLAQRSILIKKKTYLNIETINRILDDEDKIGGKTKGRATTGSVANATEKGDEKEKGEDEFAWVDVNEFFFFFILDRVFGVGEKSAVVGDA